MFEQVAALSLVAAFSPPAVLIAALYLRSARPATITALYLLGGIFVVTIVGLAGLLAIRAGGLSHIGQRQPRYGLRLGMGIAALIAAAVIAMRKPKEKPSGKPGKRGLVSRLTDDPKPWTAFVAGVFIFGPSITFLAAVQVVATDKASVASTVGAMLLIVLLTVSFAWVPLIVYLFRPDATVRKLNDMEEWLRRNRKVIMVAAVGVIGVVLTIQGAAGLVG